MGVNALVRHERPSRPDIRKRLSALVIRIRPTHQQAPYRTPLPESVPPSEIGTSVYRSAGGHSRAPSAAGFSTAPISRAPSVAAISRAPSAAAVQRAPSAAGISRVSSAAGIIRAPSAAGTVHAPSVAGTVYAPSAVRGAYAPSAVGTARAPSTRARSPSVSGIPRAPSAAGTHRAPSVAAIQRAPSAAGTHYAPSAAGTQYRAPSVAGTHRSPSAAGIVRAPSAAGTHRSPSVAASQRVPPSIIGSQRVPPSIAGSVPSGTAPSRHTPPPEFVPAPSDIAPESESHGGAALRAQARLEGDKMAMAFEASQAAYRDGEGERAKELAAIGRTHQTRMQELHAEAAQQVFNEKNEGREPGEIGLHGLYVKEALSRLSEFIREAPTIGQTNLRVITGKGLHSKGDPQILPAVEDTLRKKGLRHHTDEANAGVIVVELGPRSPVSD
ncbi:hypothetical protein FS749_009031 [Ceratobasidium sp. UAMH 11750]|nr:hypothetical protein FS749_009031 [Ceratobasidium sp. UAMH 11750]